MNIFDIKIRKKIEYDCVAIDAGFPYSLGLWYEIAAVFDVKFADLYPLGPQNIGSTSCPCIIYKNKQNIVDYYNCWDAKDCSIAGTTIQEAFDEIKRKTGISLHSPYVIK